MIMQELNYNMYVHSCLNSRNRPAWRAVGSGSQNLNAVLRDQQGVLKLGASQSIFSD